MGQLDASSVGVTRSPSPVEDRDLRVVLEIDRGGPCFMDELEGELLEVDVRVSDGICYSEVTVCESVDGDDQIVTKHHSDTVCAHCPGTVFTRFGCIPRFLRQTEESFVIKTFVPDTATVTELVDELRRVCARVRLVSIVDVGSGTGLADEIAEVDLSALTPKQREALELAVEMGYYEPGEEPSMATLGDRVGISASAFSQRLSRAEAKVMGQVTDE